MPPERRAPSAQAPLPLPAPCQCARNTSSELPVLPRAALPCFKLVRAENSWRGGVTGAERAEARAGVQVGCAGGASGSGVAPPSAVCLAECAPGHWLSLAGSGSQRRGTGRAARANLKPAGPRPLSDALSHAAQSAQAPTCSPLSPLYDPGSSGQRSREDRTQPHRARELRSRGR
eukprot:2412524-Rhodomonas_salina.2